MSEKSMIPWCHSSLSAWEGCTKCSKGCEFCYAAERDKRLLHEKILHFGPGRPRRHVKLFEQTALRMNKKPWICNICGHPHTDTDINKTCRKCGLYGKSMRRTFGNSLSDFLDEEVDIRRLAAFLDVVRRCCSMTWILSTKRPHLWKTRMSKVIDLDRHGVGELNEWLVPWVAGYGIPRNIELLTSVESQDEDWRVAELLDIPARLHGVSLEPLLGPVDLRKNFWLSGQSRRADKTLTPRGTQTRIKWVVVGGETGNNARPCRVEWIQQIAQDCRDEGVPCFVNQLGSYVTSHKTEAIAEVCGLTEVRHLLRDRNGADMKEWPSDLQHIRQLP